MVHFCIYPNVLGVSQSIERILNSAQLWHHQKIQYGRQDGCRSDYYSNSVHIYPIEIILVSIPRYSAALLLIMTLVRQSVRGMGTKHVGWHSNDAIFLCCCTLRQHFMRYGHGPGGIVGITPNEQALCRWSLNLHICSRLTQDIADFEDAVQIGEAQLQEFEWACPTGFYQTIKRKVIGKKKRGVGTMEQCDLGLIFARVIALMSTRAFKLNVMLKYELAPFPLPSSIRKVVRSGFPRHQAKTPGGSYESLNRYPRRCGYWWICHTVLRVLQWPSISFIKDIVLNFVKYAPNKMHSYNGHMYYLIDVTQGSMMQPVVSEHARLLWNTNWRWTLPTATATWPLSYEEQGPANWPDIRRTSKTWWSAPEDQLGHYREISCTNVSENQSVGPTNWLEDDTRSSRQMSSFLSKWWRWHIWGVH